MAKTKVAISATAELVHPDGLALRRKEIMARLKGLLEAMPLEEDGLEMDVRNVTIKAVTLE